MLCRSTVGSIGGLVSFDVSRCVADHGEDIDEDDSVPPAIDNADASNDADDSPASHFAEIRG
jgi:hypothetical protein